MARTNLSSQFDADTRKRTGAHIVARNTFERREGNETIIRLHSTDIVRKLSDGSVILNSGGWRTGTTKNRMNNHLPGGVRLYADKGQWWLSTGAWNADKTTRVAYFDGVRVPQCFSDPKLQATGERRADADRVLRKKIKLFCAKLDELAELPAPDNGDCWFCLMREEKTGKPLGEVTGDNSHMLAHVEESYLHGSLILNALIWAGYKNPGFIWQMDNADRKRGRKPDLVKRALRRYLLRQLGLAT